MVEDITKFDSMCALTTFTILVCIQFRLYDKDNSVLKYQRLGTDG